MRMDCMRIKLKSSGYMEPCSRCSKAKSTDARKKIDDYGIIHDYVQFSCCLDLTLLIVKARSTKCLSLSLIKSAR